MFGAMNESNDSIWIDVREKDEIMAGTLKAAYWLPLSFIQQGGPALDQALSQFDKKKTLLLFCRSGNRSGLVKDIFDKMGFTTKNVGAFSHLAGQGLITHQPTNPVIGKNSP